MPKSEGFIGRYGVCIDMKLKVTYRYIQSHQPEKQLAALIRFLLKQQRDKPNEENDRSTLLPR